MLIKKLSSERVCTPKGIYSQGIEVSLPERMIFVSGMTARNAAGNIAGRGDVVAQAELVFANIEAVLHEAGGTLDNVVKLTIFLTDMDLLQDLHAVRARCFKEPYPACSTVEVSRLANPDYLIEIEAVAVVEG